MRLTRSMTKMKKTIDHETDGNNKKRSSSPTSLQPDVVSMDHAAKKARTQQPESPTTSGHDTPTRHSLSPIDNHSTSSHSFNDNLSPTDIYYDEQEFSAHSQSPACSPPPLTIVNRSDGVRYSDLNDDHPLGDDNDDDHQDYSAFGWPSMGPGEDDINQAEDSSMSDRPLQRSLLQDFLQVEDYHSNSDPTMMTAQQPTDEMDLFFSASQADYASMSFTTKLSVQQQKQELLALSRPTYITLWPHFLTLEYFDKHDAQDRADIVPSPSGSPAKQPLDDITVATPSSASYFDTKFSVLERIGSGEYADVWKVWNTESNEVFAIKKLKMPFQSFADRWLQLVEVRNMMMVQSPFCLNLFSAWEQDGFLYLQTDCAVATLADYLHHEESSIPETTAWKIIYEISMGLQAIHLAGVVHLDLKPSNILIDPNGTLRIGDFGTSIRRPLDVYEFKGEGDRHYMAPDLLREEYDTPADVFSLGLIIFEMMTQIQLPSSGDSWEMLRLGDFSDYKQRLGTVPLEIRRVMLMMLKSSSEDRATMDDILALPHLQRIAPISADQQSGALYDFVQLIQGDEQE